MKCPNCQTPIADTVIQSEIGRRNSAKRKTHRGGRKPGCMCGDCEKCKRRIRMAEYRANRHKS